MSSALLDTMRRGGVPYGNAATLLRCNVPTVRHLVAIGTLAPFEGNDHFVDRDSLQSYLDLFTDPTSQESN